MRHLLLVAGSLALSLCLSLCLIAAETDDFAAALGKLEPRTQDLRQAGFGPVRRTLERMLAAARAADDIPAQIAILRRIARLPASQPQPGVEPVPATTTADGTAAGADRAAINDLELVDRQFEQARLATDRQLGELYAPLRDAVAKAFALALASPERKQQSIQLWELLHPLPQAWSPELLSEPFMAGDGYDRTHALPIAALPAYLELTVEPGGHDVHVGISGTSDEEITEIYLGGWWGRQSGIRSVPGGQDLAGKNEFALFDPSRTLPSEADLLKNDRAGTPFHSTLPTTFRIAVSTCGIVVSRTDVAATEVVMRTAQVFNTPTAFVFRSPSYRLTSLRISPASTWNDVTRLPPAATGPVGF